jgi:multidrug resistance protein, MATE family
LMNRAQAAYETQSVNLITQRSVLLLWCFCIPLCVLWMFSGSLMTYCGQSSEIAQRASSFLLYLIPELFFFVLIVCMQKWLHLHQTFTNTLVANIAAALVHPWLCYICMYTCGLGFHGAAVARSITRFIELLILLLFTIHSGLFTKKKFRLSSKAFSGWGDILKEGLGRTLHMTDWWAAEIVIFMGGLFAHPDIELSTMYLYRIILDVCAGFPTGLHEVGGERVRRALARCDIEDALKAAYVGPLLAGAMTSTFSVFLLFFSTPIASFFVSGDFEVVHLLNILMLPLCAYAVADAVQSVLSGVLQATHTLNRAAPFVTACYYLIGIPVAVYLAVPGLPGGKGWGVVGISWGIASAVIAHVAVCLYVTATIPWGDLERTIMEEAESAASGRGRSGSNSQSLINFIKDSSSNEGEGRDGTRIDDSTRSVASSTCSDCEFTVSGDVVIPEVGEPSLQQRFQRFLSYLPIIRVASSARYDLVQSYTAALEDVSSHDDMANDDVYSIEL